MVAISMDDYVFDDAFVVWQTTCNGRKNYGFESFGRTLTSEVQWGRLRPLLCMPVNFCTILLLKLIHQNGYTWIGFKGIIHQ